MRNNEYIQKIYSRWRAKACDGVMETRDTTKTAKAEAQSKLIY
ncbi:MAG: hypothetical protein ACJ70N_01355 [Nitrososphaera sp.]